MPSFYKDGFTRVAMFWFMTALVMGGFKAKRKMVAANFCFALDFKR